VRFRAHDGSTVHLSYCSNVHPAETAAGVVEQLTRFAGPVRRSLGVDVLGVGLWLSAEAAVEFETGGLTELRETLASEGLEVVTLNGFPCGGFHDPVVKHAVYSPDWTTETRAEHTLRLGRLLASLLPDDVDDGTISTLPLAYRDPWARDQHATAVAQLRRVGAGFAELDKRIVLAVEPEPGCVLETSAQVRALIEEVDHPNVGACLDVAHFAVQWEDPALVFPVAKAQLAVALEVADPIVDADVLRRHDEPRFLHQVRQCGGGGTDDLPEALGGALDGTAPWRVHVHLPVHAASWTTQNVLTDVLERLVGGPVPLTRSLEVETYTWTVLPEGVRPTDDAGLVAGLTAELAWTRDALLRLGLKELR